MADNYLITGYWGEPHVTAENDRGINASIFGDGKFVLPVGEKFRAEYIGNNTVRIYDGKLLDNGAAAGIPAGKYIDLLIPEAGQGMNRNDLIIFQYSQDTSTLVESGVFTVLSGTETNGTAADPVLHEEDLLTDEATFDQMALWRVSVSGTNISTPVQLFEVSKDIRTAGPAVVTATSDDGVAYSAKAPGVSKLFPGLEVTIIPEVTSTTTTITLDLNGLGAKMVRLPLSSNTALLVQPAQEGFFVDNRPVKLIYDNKYATKGAWVVVGRERPNGSDIYGSVPIECGGTGADNVNEARENLGLNNSGNRLDNSYFVKPVNQRDSASYTGAVYGIDRWTGHTDDAAVSVENGYVKFSSTGNGQSRQYINTDEVNLYGKKITIACEDKDGNVYCASGTVPASKPTSNTLVCSVGKDSAKIRFHVDSNGKQYVSIYTPFCEWGLKWAALYEGEYTAENLPVYQPKGYNVELLECYRYFYSAKLSLVCFTKGNTQWSTNGDRFPVPMRINPTVANLSEVLLDGIDIKDKCTLILDSIGLEGIYAPNGDFGTTKNKPLMVKVDATADL